MIEKLKIKLLKALMNDLFSHSGRPICVGLEGPFLVQARRLCVHDITENPCGPRTKTAKWIRTGIDFSEDDPDRLTLPEDVYYSLSGEEV